MCYDEFKLKNSPFQKIDGFKKSSKRESVRTDIAPEDNEIIEKYIRQRAPDFDPKKKNNKFDKSKFVRELLMDFFNSIALEKKSFEDIYVILLFSKTEESNVIDGEIVGLIENDDLFYNENHFNYYKGDKNKFNFIYYYEKFNDRNYDEFLLSLKSKEKLFYCVDENIQQDFYLTFEHLKECHQDINFEDCYFTVFNINNYLDVLFEGQYVGKKYSTYWHEGVIVLLDPYSEDRVCISLNWTFHDYEMKLELDVIDVGEFNVRTINETNIDELIKEYWSITNMYSREDALEMRIKDLNESIEQLTRMRDEKLALLDEIRENK